MNLILLSGGSGKRLWPLSNDIRSKQFVKMLSDGQGGYESMVTRVHRQLSCALDQPEIVVATSKTQASAIRNQLGDSVSICVEPCRRDTFPAIALAAAYLHDKLNVCGDECVVVCPVDAYVDESFFAAFEKLADLVKKPDVHLALMGIEPTAPSEKFGYILPTDGGNVASVERFVEKPKKPAAEKLIAQGALWNAGVFAFRLSYLLNKAQELIGFSDYQLLYDRYDQLKRISFDYAVVEGESNIQVLRYAGEWRDVGTWSTISEVLDSPVIGNATLDDTCVNVHVVNELNVPVLAMGCRDMIIAASGDGILIADKRQSDQMKPYVEKINSEVRYAEKSWGAYTVMDSQSDSKVGRMDIMEGRQLSYHCHHLRKEIWTVTSGCGVLVLNGVEQNVSAGSCITIDEGVYHSVRALTPMTIIEVQLGSELRMDDKSKLTAGSPAL